MLSEAPTSKSGCPRFSSRTMRTATNPASSTPSSTSSVVAGSQAAGSTRSTSAQVISSTRPAMSVSSNRSSTRPSPRSSTTSPSKARGATLSVASARLFTTTRTVLRQRVRRLVSGTRMVDCGTPTGPSLQMVVERGVRAALRMETLLAVKTLFYTNATMGMGTS